MSGPRSPRWSLAVPALVLAGLFGMHGLGAHSGGHDTMPMASMSGTMSAGSPMADHAGVAMARGSVDGPAVAPAPGGSTYGGMLGMCLAVLLGGLVALLLVRSGSRRTPWTLPRQAVVPVPVPRSRAPDGPTPLLLSVCRC